MSYPIPQGLLVLKKREQNRPKKERRGGKKRKIRGREMRHRNSASLKWHSLPASVYCPFCLCSHLSAYFLLFNMFPNVSSRIRFRLQAFCPSLAVSYFQLFSQILFTSAFLFLPLHRCVNSSHDIMEQTEETTKPDLWGFIFPPSLKMAL